MQSLQILSLPSQETVLPQIVTYVVVEKGMENKDKLGRVMMQPLQLLRLAKRHTQGQSDIE